MKESNAAGLLVQTAVVHHKHGVNFYVALTQAGIDRQLADYARSWWSDAFPDEANDPSCKGKELSDKEIAEAYFEVMDGEEYVDEGTAIVAD